LILVPLAQRKEVSLILDRNRGAVTDHRIEVGNARYRGRDDRGRPFSLSAGSAVQISPQSPVVDMKQLVAMVQLSDGRAEIAAPSGAYNFDSGQIVIPGPVNVIAPGGYRLVTSDVDVDLRARKPAATGGIRGELPTGTFSAEQMLVDLEARTVTLQGNARLRMTPGNLRLPK
jgi:lipopolysaccharide export system protein LptC